MKRSENQRNPRLIPTQDAKSASQAATAPPIGKSHFPLSEVALILQVSLGAVYRQRDSGKLPIVVIGKFQYVSRQWIEADT
jgi:hypothetical protein